MTVKAAGMEISLEQVATAAAALGAAGMKDPGATSSDEVAQTVRVAARDASKVSLSHASVLWVDDHPENNQYEARALTALGVRIISAKSTEEALLQLARHHFSVVITDLGRTTESEDDPDAGIHLLNELRDQGSTTPCVVYAGARAITERDRILNSGAASATNRPTELLSTVVSLIVNAA